MQNIYIYAEYIHLVGQSKRQQIFFYLLLSVSLCLRACACLCVYMCMCVCARVWVCVCRMCKINKKHGSLDNKQISKT